ncbi:MAG: endonuclease MutS2 [Thermodesulfobacteriota bacterium]|nr:endonuclease MutS2 [Thermodesulfobacteriota bacterium]
MNEHTLQVLEFYNVLDVLKGFATSSLGKSFCESVKPQGNMQGIMTLLDEVTELKEVITLHGDIPIHGIVEIEGCVARAKVEGSVLYPSDFLDILSTLKTTHQLKRFFSKLEDNRYPLLNKIGSRFITLPDVESRIEQSVGAGGNILDNASPELKKTRENIKKLRMKIQNSLESLFSSDSMQSFFQERIITIRNGRYVIPLKSDYKGHIQGIIHDHSHSRATYFVEPLSTIELNNELGVLLKREKDEELLILKNLTQLIRNNSEEILANLKLLGHTDLTYAKARYSIEFNANKPLLNNRGRVNLIGAYHPLLLSSQDEEKDAVPIDIHFDKRCNTLIITGANTGGKTVALKTVGILTLMAQAGLHIPVSNYSETSVFDAIFADIGDEQDIGQSLSTFSSRMYQIVEILNRVDGSSLVLLDELGVGTNPHEGAGLAMAILDYLRKKGASIVATTHLELLKAYAYLNKDVMNVSVLFDSETLQPRYSLIYGTSGESNALVIAERLGIPHEILNNAKNYVEDRNSNASKLMRALEEYQRAIIEEKNEIAKIREQTLVYQKQVESLMNKIREKKDRILLETGAKAKEVLRKTEKEAKQIVKDLKKRGEYRSFEPSQRLKSLRKEIHFLRPVPTEREERKLLSSLRKGDAVKITSLNKEGVVINTQKESDQVDVLIGNLRVKARINNLEKAYESGSDDHVFNGEISFDQPVSEKKSEINVIGLRVDDALPLVDKAIDRAILNGMTELDIIHGRGTGRLREAIREYLSNHSFVEKFFSADLSHGGAGVTVVGIRA